MRPGWRCVGESLVPSMEHMRDATQATTPTMGPMSFTDQPYLQRLQSLHHAFPALKSFLEKLANEKEPGRAAVQEHFERLPQKTPGRCYCLKFNENSVEVVNNACFATSDALRKYLKDNPATQSRTAKQRRLFILEDMEPDYVDALGHHLGVDPLVFSEQMNTWNFTDSWSIPHRGLPSMSVPGQSFTLRYYELRTLFDPKSVDVLSLQMSFAINRRRYERWRDIDVPSVGKPDRRHAFVRRCASFWTSQDMADEGEEGWDAVIMVDPAFAAARSASIISNTTNTGIRREEAEVVMGDGTKLDEAARANLEECSILQANKTYTDRTGLWDAQGYGAAQTLVPTPHKSWPYHDGCSTLAPLLFSQIGIDACETAIQHFRSRRNLNSPMDEMVFYWTQLARPELIADTNKMSSNAAYYLLKHVAQHWVNHLELMNTTIAKAEWFSDDYQASIDDNLSRQKWKNDLVKINNISKDINYMRRHLNHFWRAMYLNLERLGVQLGAEAVNENLSMALRGAQKDFLTIHTRMQPMRDRAEALNSVSNDLANLRAAFRGVHDGEFGLRLSLFASVVFPLTLVATIFSMGEAYLPGEKEFWKLWAIGPPFCVGVALVLVYGKRPWRIVGDVREYGSLWKKKYVKSRERKEEERRGEKERRMVSGEARMRKGWTVGDEESGVVVGK
ncbi:hypothetical protein DE146DRAFT_704720 [Phaeosphaeria sp. MPI-PUGE-AT-0046c]|nr:hypothetical protein DE146DRAFT_704720 [Phaeosphaeria sp. MPI-PUGE-AT-0046c]